MKITHRTYYVNLAREDLFELCDVCKKMVPKIGHSEGKCGGWKIKMAACRTPNQGRRESKAGFRMAGER